MTTFLDRLKLGLSAFREAYLTGPLLDSTDWSDRDARAVRYDILWAQYEQSSYRDVHNWATAYRKKYGLYKYIRPIYNPAYRLGEFWKTHLFGGLLDPDAGETGAIPIATDNDALRPAIATLWKYSQWGTRKDILSVRGTILGDAVIQIVDDVHRERVYLDLVHPGNLLNVELDTFGNVRAYTIVETRDNPNGAGTVEYREVVSRSGQNVVYETFLNGRPYAWPENVDRSGTARAAWQEPYGFIPLVVIQHNNVGLEWGWSELHPIRAKCQEADDLASMISDQVRKHVQPIWLMKGMKQVSLTTSGADATTDIPAPGREELNALWNLPTDAKAEAMIADLDFEQALAHLSSILAEIERDVPELSPDINTASGDASGRALRVARQPVTVKVQQRRANYDDALVRAHQMAIAIGGWRGYEGYRGFGLDSYAAGALDHHIADRPVFDEDPLDEIEVRAAFWKAAGEAGKAGVSLEAFLRDAGWSEDRIAGIIGADVAPEN